MARDAQKGEAVDDISPGCTSFGHETGTEGGAGSKFHRTLVLENDCALQGGKLELARLS